MRTCCFSMFCVLAAVKDLPARIEAPDRLKQECVDAWRTFQSSCEYHYTRRFASLVITHPNVQQAVAPEIAHLQDTGTLPPHDVARWLTLPTRMRKLVGELGTLGNAVTAKHRVSGFVQSSLSLSIETLDGDLPRYLDTDGFQLVLTDRRQLSITNRMHVINSLEHFLTPIPVGRAGLKVVERAEWRVLAQAPQTALLLRMSNSDPGVQVILRDDGSLLPQWAWRTLEAGAVVSCFEYTVDPSSKSAHLAAVVCAQFYRDTLKVNITDITDLRFVKSTVPWVLRIPRSAELFDLRPDPPVLFGRDVGRWPSDIRRLVNVE